MNSKTIISTILFALSLAACDGTAAHQEEITSDALTRLPSCSAEIDATVYAVIDYLDGDDLLTSRSDLSSTSVARVRTLLENDRIFQLAIRTPGTRPVADTTYCCTATSCTQVDLLTICIDSFKMICNAHGICWPG